jgi:hypothetical protein
MGFATALPILLPVKESISSSGASPRFNQASRQRLFNNNKAHIVGKLKLPALNSQAGAWELAEACYKRPVISRLLNMLTALNPPDSTDQQIDFLMGVVKRQRWAHGAFQAKAPQDRLRAVMAGAHRDAGAV